MNSSKKRTNKFDFTTMIPQVDLFSFVFWEKLKTPKRHFEINWPLTKYIYCILYQTLHKWKWFPSKLQSSFRKNLNPVSDNNKLSVRVVRACSLSADWILNSENRIWISYFVEIFTHSSHSNRRSLAFSRLQPPFKNVQIDRDELHSSPMEMESKWGQGTY